MRITRGSASRAPACRVRHAHCPPLLGAASRWLSTAGQKWAGRQPVIAPQTLRIASGFGAAITYAMHRFQGTRTPPIRFREVHAVPSRPGWTLLTAPRPTKRPRRREPRSPSEDIPASSETKSARRSRSRFFASNTYNGSREVRAHDVSARGKHRQPPRGPL